MLLKVFCLCPYIYLPANFINIRLSSTLELVVISNNMQHVTLKSPKMSSDDNKQSNYRLMNVLCRKKLYLLILVNLQSNKRQKKETLRFSHQHFAYRHLPKREIFHSYINYRKLFTFFSFPDQSSCIKS